MTDSEYLVIAGLGNPGSGYDATRHNIGFRVLDSLARRRGAEAVPGGDDVREARLRLENGVLILLWPQRYMNRSGQALRAWSRDTGIALTGAAEREPDGDAEPGPDPDRTGTGAPPPAIRPLIVCDDLSLPLGSLRLRARGSSGGQNGLESIIEQLGGEEFPRLRLGIAPGADEVPPSDWTEVVLGPFAASERDDVEDLVERAVVALECWIESGLEAAASRHNRRMRPEAD